MPTELTFEAFYLFYVG